MAKHSTRTRRRRKMGKYIRGEIQLDQDLGTLAANTGVRSAVSDVVGEATRISSIVVTYSLSSWTPAANTGPILVGVAHSDYTLVEIEEFLESTTSWNVADLVSQEVSNRKIRRVGLFGSPDAATDIAVLNDGKPIKTKLNWMLQTGQNLVFFAYNTGTAAIATTDPDVHYNGHANLWPKS